MAPCSPTPSYDRYVCKWWWPSICVCMCAWEAKLMYSSSLSSPSDVRTLLHFTVSLSLKLHSKQTNEFFIPSHMWLPCVEIKDCSIDMHFDQTFTFEALCHWTLVKTKTHMCLVDACLSDVSKTYMTVYIEPHPCRSTVLQCNQNMRRFCTITYKSGTCVLTLPLGFIFSLSTWTTTTGTTVPNWPSRRFTMCSMWPAWTPQLAASPSIPDSSDTLVSLPSASQGWRHSSESYLYCLIYPLVSFCVFQAITV